MADTRDICETCGDSVPVPGGIHICGRCAEDWNDRDISGGTARINRRRRLNGLEPIIRDGATEPDRQAGRARTWAVELIQPGEDWFAGRGTVDAATREDAWNAAYALAIEYGKPDAASGYPGRAVAPQAVSLAPLTRGEYGALDGFLHGGHRSRVRSLPAGVRVDDLGGSRSYVHPEYRLRADIDSLPAYADLARGESRIASVGPRSTEWGRWTRCHADKYPDAFEETGRWIAWCGWPEDTSPVFETEDEARRCGRLHGSGRARLQLDGVTIATVHCAVDVDGVQGGPLLRVLANPARIGPRAARLTLALRSLAKMRHPSSRFEIETEPTPRELEAVLADPRDLAARDARAADLAESMRANGRVPVVTSNRDGTVTVEPKRDDLPHVVAVVRVDGSAALTWADGTVSEA